jgi:hypothetical protein
MTAKASRRTQYVGICVLAGIVGIRQQRANISRGSCVSLLCDVTKHGASDRGNNDRRALATQSGFDAIRRAFGEFALSSSMLMPGLS